MVDATLFVAIAIACVIALLLLTVMFVYCLKRHHDKQQNREIHDRRVREERHRRNLMRAQIVRPPPYDTQRRNVLTMVQEPVPFTPPPAYKELATPIPPRDGRDGVLIGIGGMAVTPTPVTPTPTYGVQQSQTTNVSRNIAPANTSYSSNNNNSSSNNNNYVTLTNVQNNNSVGGRSAGSNNVNNQGHHQQHNPNTVVSRNIHNQTRPSHSTLGGSAVDAHTMSSQTRRHHQINTHVRQSQPRPDPPSYSSLQQRRATITGQNNNNNNNQTQSQSYTINSTSNQSSPGSHTNSNPEENRTAARNSENNGANHQQVATSRSRNTMPEIEDLSLI